MIKERNTGNISAVSGTYQVNNGPHNPISAMVSGSKEYMSTISNPNWLSDLDGGSPWNHQRVSFSSPIVEHGHYGRRALNSAGDGRLYYQGGLSCTRVWGAETSFISFDPSSYGPQAYSRMKPAQPVFDGAVAIAELRELPSLIMQRFIKDLRGISNFWVALQFGWKPLLSDIRKLYQIQREMEKRLDQLIRDNGRPVRRKVTLASTQNPSTHTTVGSAWGWIQGMPTNTGVHISAPVYNQWYNVQDEVWASARFRYHLPPGPKNMVWRRTMLAKLYGLRPAPSVIWNIMPWSWLVDWFSNVGDVIENLDAGVANRVAADYFYVMGRRKETALGRVTAFPKSYFPNVPARPVNAECISQRVSQRRLRGDPFGFATNQDSLDSMQLSILGALGYSRLSGRP